jgi:tRNA(His) 5'-end guanylyltransferase
LGDYAFMESDEISVLLPRDWDLFDQSLEKAISISAGIASSQFSCAIKEKIEVTTTRRRIKIDRELPMKEEYRSFIQQILEPPQVLLPSSEPST